MDLQVTSSNRQAKVASFVTAHTTSESVIDNTMVTFKLDIKVSIITKKAEHTSIKEVVEVPSILVRIKLTSIADFFRHMVAIYTFFFD